MVIGILSEPDAFISVNWLSHMSDKFLLQVGKPMASNLQADVHFRDVLEYLYLIDMHFTFAPVFSFIYCWVLVFALSTFYTLILYVLGDDALISYEYFVWASHLCVLVLIWAGLARPEAGFGPPVKYFY